MAKLRVTKKFSFEMSHALLGYDGLCRNIHGHSYKMHITLLGEVLSDSGHPKNGMVMDFHQLKLLINEKIVAVFDHTLVINAKSPKEQIDALKKSTERLIILDFQPSTENLCVYFADQIKDALPQNVSLYSIRLYETENSFAEWFACDNL